MKMLPAAVIILLAPSALAQEYLISTIGAPLNRPSSAAVDSARNLYIADYGNHRVLKVAPGGTISVAAGNGSQGGYSGDGGPATSAQLWGPMGVALDSGGNLYIADRLNHRIRKVSPGGTISTVAGNGVSGKSGDGGPATSAQLRTPEGVAVDFGGNLYIAEGADVRKVAPNGTISTVAGTGICCSSEDGGLATNVWLNYPAGIAVDAAGNLFIAEANSNRIRKVAPNGQISTVAGSGTKGYWGDGGLATSAQLNYPLGVAVDTTGNLYIADRDNNGIRKVTPGGAISTVAGNGRAGYSGDGGTAANAQLNHPGGVAVDAGGNVYVADGDNAAIRLLQPVKSLLSISGLTNAASNLAGPIAQGEIVVIYGSGLGPSQLAQYKLDNAGKVGTELAGTRVLINNTVCPLIYTSSTQVAAVVPYISFNGAAAVQVEYQGRRSDMMMVNIANSSPGLFTLNSSGQGQAAAFNQDGSLNTAAMPAKPGTIVSLFATGEGPTNPDGVDGKPATTPLPRPIFSVWVMIGDQFAEVIYAGSAPGLVGMMQVNARIPDDTRAGAVPVALWVGMGKSQAGVTIAVSGN
jgi:uncharacterized protein (TIGR03437 family)